MTSTLSMLLAELPQIDEVKPWSRADQDLFDELASVLRKHGASSRFGITLLHKHFQLADGEILVEVCDADARTLTTRPQPRTDLGTTNVIETNWRFDLPNIVSQTCWSVCEDDGVGGHPKTHTVYDDSPPGSAP
jgi:hypothetical protein